MSTVTTPTVGMSSGARSSALTVYRPSRDPYGPTPEDHTRSLQMQRAWDAYDGKFRGGDDQWPLVWKKGKEPNPNVLINRCGPACDTDVAWLFGDTVKVALDADAPAEAQEYVDKVWGVSADDSSDDDKMELLQKLALNGAVTGHAFLKIVWDSANGAQEYPQLLVLDSTTIRVMTDPHNCEVPLCYVEEYRIPDPADPDGGSAMFRQVTEMVDAEERPLATAPRAGQPVHWRITNYRKSVRGSAFVPLWPEECPGGQNPMPWPYAWAPIQDCAHMVRPNRYWGRPRITPDVIHVNEVDCTIASDTLKIALMHAHPVLYTIKTGNNQRALIHEPGTILEVSSDIKAVAAYGDLPGLLQLEGDMRGNFDEESHIPAEVFGRQTAITRTPTSGVAIRLHFGALVSDIKKERRTYGALIRTVTQCVMELKNPAWADTAVLLEWQDPLPADDLQQAQVVQTAIAAGIMSKETGASKMGLIWDDEQANMQDEAQASVSAVTRGAGFPQLPQATDQNNPLLPPSAPRPGQPAQQRPGQSPIQQPGGSLPPAGQEGY